MKTLLAPALALLLASCSLATEPEGDTRVGIVTSQYLRSPALVAPDTVAAGQDFTVTVTTLGFNGCWQAAGARVARDAARATIVPHDRVVDAVCHQALVELSRTVTLRFARAGTATVVVEGRGEAADGQTTTVRIEHPVVVR